MPPSKVADPLSRQLECIRLSVENVLKNLDNEGSIATLVNIEIIDGNYVLVSHGDLTAEISPTCPGSILHNKVSVVLKTDDEVFNNNEQASSNDPAHTMAYISADRHYARFHPLHQPLNKEFYKQEQPRITFFTNNAPALEKAAKAGLKNLSSTFSPAYSSSSFQVYWCPVTSAVPITKPLHNKQMKVIGDSGLKDQAVNHKIIAADAILSRSALISKSDIVITDSTSIAIDAVISSVPVGFSTPPPLGFADIQHCFDRYILHTNRKIVIDEQSLTLTEQIGNLNHLAYVTDSEQELQALLVDHLVLNSSSNLSSTKSYENSLIIKPHTQALIEPAAIYTFDRRFTSGRRKWRKFRESPKRFLHDSQHWALKPVKSFAR